MWKRIHSNRDPRDTLYSEIHNEFARYFTLAGNGWKRLTGAYPKLFFGSMVTLMTISMVLSFTVFRHPLTAKTAVANNVNPVEKSFDQIMQVAGNLRENMQLKKLVDSLAAKRQLSEQDSTLLDSALSRLSKIHQTI